MSDKSKPQEQKQVALRYKQPADDKSSYITVPILGYQIDTNPSNKIQNQPRQDLVLAFTQAGVEKLIEKNRQLLDAINEFNVQLMDVISKLIKPPEGQSIKDIQEIFEKRPEAFKTNDDPFRCFFSDYPFATTDQNHEHYPYINSLGETCANHFGQAWYQKNAKGLSISYSVPEVFYKVSDGKIEKSIYMVPNHDLANFIKNKSKFIKRFLATVEFCLSSKPQSMAEAKSSHTPTISSSSSVQAAAIPDPKDKDFDREMIVFLLEMGISWEFFPLPNFLTVFEKLSPLTQWRCFTEPTKNNSIFVYDACVGKYSKKFSKMIFDVAKQCINALDEQGRTALMQAVAVGDIAGAEVLLSWGANIDAADNDVGTVLHYLLALKNKISSEKRLQFLRKLKEGLELSEAKKSQQESQIDKWRNFVNRPNKAGETSLLVAVAQKNSGFVKDLLSLAITCKDARFAKDLLGLAITCKDTGFTKDLLSVEGTLPLMFELIENFSTDKRYTEQVEILKQDALEFAATRANVFAIDSEDFARYKGYMESLIAKSARISEDFVNKLSAGSAKDFLQGRLDIRNKKRAKNERKKKGEWKSVEKPSHTAQGSSKSADSAAESKEAEAPSPQPTRQTQISSDSLLPEQPLTQQSKLCLEMLERVPSLLGVAPLDPIIKHFETEGDSCVKHLTQLLESKQNGEASVFFDVMMKILKENQLNVITALKKRDYSDSQLTPLIWVFNKKALEVNALMEKLAPSVTSQGIPVADQAGRSSVWGSSVPLLSPALSSSLFAEFKNVSKKQMPDSAYQPIKGLTLEGLMFLKDNAQNMFDSANGLIADFQEETESEKETAIDFARNSLHSCLSEINKVRFQANHMVLTAAHRTNFLKELDQLEAEVNAAKAALEPPPVHKNTLG